MANDDYFGDEHGHDHEHEEEPPSNPLYDALSAESKERLDSLVAETQNMQNAVDKDFAVLGPAVFFLGSRILHLSLMVEVLVQRIAELEAE